MTDDYTAHDWKKVAEAEDAVKAIEHMTRTYGVAELLALVSGEVHSCLFENGLLDLAHELSGEIDRVRAVLVEALDDLPPGDGG